MEAGSRSIQQQVNGEGRVVLFIGTAEHPVVVHDGAPDPLRVEVAAAGDPGVGLLVDEDAVPYLFGQPQHDAAVKLEIFRIVRPVPLSLKLGLFGQVLCLGGRGLLRAGDAGGKPEVTAQMLPGAKLLLGLPQPFGRVERPAKAAFDVGAVFLGALAQGDVGQPLVGVDAAAGGVHRAGMLHRHPVGLYHLGGHGAGHEGRQQAVQMEMQPGLLMHRAVEQLEFGVDGQQCGFQFVRLRGRLGTEGGVEILFVGGHDRRRAPLHSPPARGLHGVDQLALRHPLLPRELVLDAEKVVRMGAAEGRKHRAAGQFQRVDRVLEVEPGQIVQHGLPDVALPCVKKAAHQLVAVVFVDQPHDAVHVKINGAVGVPGEEQRLEAVGSCRRPHLIGGPPLFGGVALRFHKNAPFFNRRALRR